MKILFYRKYNTIYYSQDKNASTSVEGHFQKYIKGEPLCYFDYSCRYPSSAQLRDRILNQKKVLFQFTIVRNPWDRIVSLFVMLKRQLNKNNKLHPWFNRFGNELLDVLNKKEESFEYFVRYIAKSNKFTADSHWQDQYIGLPFMDKNFYVARFENLDTELNYIYNRINCPFEQLEKSVNQTIQTRKHYSSYYNSETRKLIKRRYFKDINIFGYNFQNV